MFNKLKKAFGFGAEDERDELISDDPVVRTPSGEHFSIDITGKTGVEESPDEITARIFEHVVTVFNASLPDFLQKSVDPERERKMLYEALSDDIKAHLKRLEGAVNERITESWRSEREKMQAEVKTLTQNAKDIEARRTELKTQQLSSERQKRAMNERIHDLERRLLASEAEKEQIELENKSMLNKVKVAQVYEKDMEEMRTMIEQLQAELKDARAGKMPQKEVVDPNPDLLKKIEELEKANAANNKRLESMSALEQENEKLVRQFEIIEKEQMPQFEAMVKNKDEKIENLSRELTQTNEALGAAQKEIAELKKNPAKTTTAEVAAPESIPDEPMTMPEDDDILTDNDWIVQPSTPKISKSQPKPEKGRSKKQNLEDGQMSLW